MERESPAERTDPLLPVITADPVSPDPPLVLDDRRLAGLLAELDAEDLLPGGPSGAASADVATDSPATVTSAGGNVVVRSPAENLPAPRRAEPVPRPLPTVIEATVIEAPRRPVAAADRYVRREGRPAEPPADAMSLTGSSRVGGSRIGTVLFTVFFLGIFLLILVEVVVSLVRASS